MLSFIVYIFTMPASIYTGDSGEIATAVYTWGIAHPTGFSTYIILAKLFSYLLPWFEFAYRLNIFSAVAASLTVGILFLILQKTPLNPPLDKGGRGRVWASIAAASSLAFGFTFWTHATILQVYSLTALFFSLAILIFLHWLESRKIRHLYLLATICGLGAGTHLTFILIAPFLLIFSVLKAMRKELPPGSIRHIFFSLLVSIVVASAIYSYIPLRAAASPELNWGNPSTKENFINYITQRDYSDKIGTRSFESWRLMLGEVGRIFSREFTWFGLIFVVAGAVVTCKKNRLFFYAGLSVIFFNILLLGNYGNSQDIIILWRYFLPSYSIMAIFLGFVFSALPARLGILTLLLPAIIFMAHFGELNKRNYSLLQNEAADILSSTPQNSILITSGDTLTGAMMYEQKVLGKRTDLVMIDDRLYTQPWYLEAKKKELEAKNHIYKDNLSFIVVGNKDKGVYSIINSIDFLKMNFDFLSHGLVYQLYGRRDMVDYQEIKNINALFWQNKNTDFLKDKRFNQDYFNNELVGIYTGALNNLGAYLVNRGSIKEGTEYFEKSVAIRENKTALYNLAGIYNALHDTQKALEYKTRLDALK